MADDRFSQNNNEKEQSFVSQDVEKEHSSKAVSLEVRTHVDQQMEKIPDEQETLMPKNQKIPVQQKHHTFDEIPYHKTQLPQIKS